MGKKSNTLMLICGQNQKENLLNFDRQKTV